MIPECRNHLSDPEGRACLRLTFARGYRIWARAAEEIIALADINPKK